jgi:spore maturation protein CgeB
MVVDVPRWGRLLGGAARPLLERRISRFHPDQIIFTTRAERLGAGAVERLSAVTRTAFWYFDPVPPAHIADLAARCHAIYVTYTHQLEAFPADGPPVRFLPQGVDPFLDRPPAQVPERYRSEVSFIGSGQYPLRHDALRAAALVSRLEVRGPGWEAAAGLPVVGGDIRGEEFAMAVAGADISLGLAAHVEQQLTHGSASNRMWKVLGVGGFYLGEYAPGIEQFARDGEHCAWFRSRDELIERVRYYLARPEDRRTIAAAGHAHALASHTYAHRLELLLAGKAYSLA